jgi:xylulokinase
VLGVSVHQVDDPINAAVRGAALPAFLALGYRTINEIPVLIRFTRVFEPDETKREIYDKIYARYRQLFKKNRKIFKALNSQK